MNRALPFLVESAQAARDQQAAGVAQASRQLAQADATQQRLQDFRAECLARSPAGTLGGSDGAGLQAYQQFVGRLDEAIGLQHQEARRRAQRLAQEQVQLQQRQQRLMALQALQRREAEAAAARAQRREQREADEFAAGAHARLAREGSA